MNTRRPRSIEVEGVAHGAAPIPMGARVGNILYSSGIAGVDPATGKLAEGAAAQAACAFRNLKCFPDPHDRPARHTLNYDLQHGMLLQLEAVAVVGAGA